MTEEHRLVPGMALYRTPSIFAAVIPVDCKTVLAEVLGPLHVGKFPLMHLSIASAKVCQGRASCDAVHMHAGKRVLLLRARIQREIQGRANTKDNGRLISGKT